MNTMVSAAAVATATAIATPSFATSDDTELFSLIDRLQALWPRYYQIYENFEVMENEWFKRRPDVDAQAAMDVAEIPYRAIWEEICALETRICATAAKTLAGIKAKARWHFQFWCDGDIDKLDPAHSSFESLFLELSEGESSATASGGSRAAHTPDPIFAAIEAHKAARIALYHSIHVQYALEKELPKDKRRSRTNFFEEEICETDDPRWIECERDVVRCHDAETAAAIELLGVQATTRAGILALLQYANTADTDGEGWPAYLVSDDGTKTRSWHYFLIEKVAENLSNAAA